MDEKQQSLSELRRDWSGTRRCILRTRLQRSCDSRDITKANPFPGSGNLALVDGDIGDSKTAAKVVETVVSRFGRVNVLVNNAGIFIPKPFSEYTTEGLNALVSTTLAGFLYISQVSVKQMLREKSGNIVNVSTTLVRHPVAGVPVTVQVMAKGALDAVRGRSRSNMPRTGIRVNTVALGVIKTPPHKPETYEVRREGRVELRASLYLILPTDSPRGRP